MGSIRGWFYAFSALSSMSFFAPMSQIIVFAFENNESVLGNDSFVSIPLIPHHVQKRRRLIVEDQNRKTEENANDERNDRAQQIGALYQGYGTHYVDLWCGTPPQRQTVIVDTGSSVTAFPCDGCRDCGESIYHIDGLFQQDLSSTFYKFGCSECVRGRCTLPKGSKHNDCRIGLSYQEGSSWTAFEAKDQCYIAGPHGEALELPNPNRPLPEKDGLDPSQASSLAFDLVFGCQTKLTGLFKTQLADGIMGMDNAHEAFWHQIYAAGKTKNQNFALCFGRSPQADRDGSEAGALTLGGCDKRLHKTPMVYTGDKTSSGFYDVHVRKVYLRAGGGGDSAHLSDPNFKITQVEASDKDLNGARTIIDSGTTDTYLTRKVQGAFKDAWKKATGKAYSQSPVKLSDSQIDRLPTILFQLQGNNDLNAQIARKDPESTPGLAGDLDPENPYDVILAVPPRHYMEYDENAKKYVARVYLDEAHGSVLGANAMMGHDVCFDPKNNMIGWAESDCDYTNLITANGYDPDVVKSGLYQSPLKKGEKRISSNNLKSGSDSYSASNNVCSTLTCRGAFLAVIVVVALTVISYIRTTQPGTLQRTSELELQHPTSDDDEDGEFPSYRDHPVHAGGDNDDDDFGSNKATRSRIS